MGDAPPGGIDIQLEHGHVRIVNPVMEALALAPFSAGQLKVMMAAIRATWGWRRKEADLSTGELAEATGLARSTAAAALRELVEAGALVQVRDPSFSAAGRYRVQKNPRRWGRFACTPPSLVSGGPDTPGDRTVREDVQECPVGRTGESGGPDTPAPEAVAPQGQTAPLKTVKDRKDSLPSTAAAVPDADPEAVASAMIRVANRGMADNPEVGSAMSPIPASHGSRTEVLEWLQEGIPREAIEAAVYETAKTYQPDPPRRRQISTMKYFTGPVHDEWARIQAENTEAPNGTSNGKRGGSRRAKGVPQRFDYSDATDEFAGFDEADPEAVQGSDTR